MAYQKPELAKVEVGIDVSTNASVRSSCDGGHCVKASCADDPWGRMPRN